MGGYFTAESEEGKGSVFTVYLPAKVTTEAAEAAKSKDSNEALPEASQPVSQADTILVIDDDPAVRDLMFRFLVKSGFNVVVAADGEEGLKLAKRVHPRIVTLDVLMPGINGWEVLRRMKADPDLAGIPVIMVTIVDNEIMGLNLGSSSYLMKPVDRVLLAELIEKHRRTRSPSTEDLPVGV